MQLTLAEFAHAPASVPRRRAPEADTSVTERLWHSADDGKNNPVALLFAGSSSTSIGNPIQQVLNAFGVSIYPESGVNAVMALIRGWLGASSRWTSVLVSQSYRNGSFGSMTAIAAPAAQDAP